MAHNDKIKDCDAFFEVDPITRQIINKTPAKIVLMQGDHNSEKFTFTLPRYIEGHDMAESAKAKLHYVNPMKADSGGMYEMTDLQIDESNPEKVKCSWLISANATKEPGALSFLIEFDCYEGDVLVYSWHTAPFKGISIGETFGFEEEIAEQYADVLEQWYNKLFGTEVDGNIFGIVDSAECTISDRSIIAKFKEPLALGQQFWYTYTVEGVDTVSGCSKGLKVSSADASKYEVTFGNKYLTDYALVGLCDIGSDTMVFTYFSENNYEAAVFSEFDIVKPIPFKYLGLNNGIILGYNNFVSDKSLNSNNFGSSNHIDGEFNNAFGTSGKIVAKSSTLFGQSGTITGNLSMLGGDRGNISGRCSFGYGTDVNISGENSGGIGNDLIVTGNNQFVVGYKNEEDTNALFIVGDNGNNIFVIKKDGRIWVNGKFMRVMTDEDVEHLKTTDAYIEQQAVTAIDYARNVDNKFESLIKLTEEEKTMLSSFESSGYDNNNLGHGSAQFGAKNYNTNENVIQLGRENTTESAAAGYIYQIGYGNRSLAGQSYLIGKKLIGEQYEQVVVGKFNSGSDGIFVVGNGTSESDRKNAMVIDKHNDVKFSGRVKASAITLVSPGGTEFDVAIRDDGTLHIT